MWRGVSDTSRRGCTTIGSCIRSQISGVTSPFAFSRSVSITSFSNAHTAILVRLPYCPSMGPGANPSSVSRCWTLVTSSPW